jgi:tetratricopeptide (TPR) repeat protein
MSEKDYKSVIDQCWRLRREKKLQEAELVLHEALAQYCAGSYEHSQLTANLADVLLHQGNLDQARRLALAVLQKEPSQVTALTVLGAAALEQKEAAEAVENLSKAYARGPNAYRAGRLARALVLDGRAAQALDVLQEALQKNPGDSYLLKQYSHLKNKTSAASVREDELLSELSREEDAFLPYAEQLKIKLQQLEPAEAAQQLQKIVKVGKRKENPHLHLLLGDLRRKAGREAEAAEAYRTAWELDPENLLALSQLLYCYRRLGRKEEAWPLLKRLLYLRPGDQTAKASFLKDAAELGKTEEALHFFTELIARYPHHKELYGMIRKLKLVETRQEGS